jgi:hypothetical protein
MRYRRAGMTVEVPVPANAVGAARLNMRRWLDDMRFRPSRFIRREIAGSDRGKVQAGDGDDHGGATASLHRDASGSDTDAYQIHAKGGHGDRRHQKEDSLCHAGHV